MYQRGTIEINKSIEEEWITIIWLKLVKRKFTELNGTRNSWNEVDYLSVEIFG